MFFSKQEKSQPSGASAFRAATDENCQANHDSTTDALSLEELRRENEVLRQQIQVFQREKVNYQLEKERLQKQTQKFRFSGSGNNDDEALQEISRLTKLLKKAEVEREAMLEKIREVQAENKSLLSQKDEDRKEILALQQKCETCDHEVRQLLRLEDEIQDLRAQLQGEGKAVAVGQKRKSTVVAPQGEERAAKKPASAQRKEIASKSSPGGKVPVRRPKFKELSSSDDESMENDDNDDMYSPSKDWKLDDQDVWVKRKEGTGKRKRQARVKSSKSSSQSSQNSTSQPMWRVSSPAASPPRNEWVSYPCPVTGCAHAIKFKRDLSPPLKDGIVSDEKPWAGPFRSQAFQMREHMSGMHQHVSEDLWPQGFRSRHVEDAEAKASPTKGPDPPSQEAPPKPALPQNRDVIDLVSDSE